MPPVPPDRAAAQLADGADRQGPAARDGRRRGVDAEDLPRGTSGVDALAEASPPPPGEYTDAERDARRSRIQRMFNLWRRTEVNYETLQRLARALRSDRPDAIDEIQRTDKELANAERVLHEVAVAAKGFRKLKQLFEDHDDWNLWLFVYTLAQLMERWDTLADFNTILARVSEDVVRRLARAVRMPPADFVRIACSQEVSLVRKERGAVEGAVAVAAALLGSDARTIYRRLTNVPPDGQRTLRLERGRTFARRRP